MNNWLVFVFHAYIKLHGSRSKIPSKISCPYILDFNFLAFLAAPYIDDIRRLRVNSVFTHYGSLNWLPTPFICAQRLSERIVHSHHKSANSFLSPTNGLLPCQLFCCCSGKDRWSSFPLCLAEENTSAVRYISNFIYEIYKNKTEYIKWYKIFSPKHYSNSEVMEAHEDSETCFYLDICNCSPADMKYCSGSLEIFFRKFSPWISAVM
jgi:hypothetical protein